MKNFVIVAHKNLPQPDDDLVLYLSRGGNKVLHIMHSFSNALDRKSYFRLYESGKLRANGEGRDFSGFPELIIHTKEFLYTLLQLIKFGGPWNYYIGMDGLCTAFALMAKVIIPIEKTVYWAIDFVPVGRFNNYLKNKIYEWVNRTSYLNVDEVWDLSPKMAEAREKKWGLKKNGVKKHRIVPYGIWIDRIKRYTFEESDRSIVFVGNLLEKQGVQLVIRSLPAILKKIPSLKFKIIGDGPYKESLEGLVLELGLRSNVSFLGRLRTNSEVEEEVARSGVGVAPYIRSLDKWTAYADPGKVKTYLACGIPVVLTNVPWNAEEVEDNGCGAIVADTPAGVGNGILRFLDKSINNESRNSAVQYSKRFNYSDIFSNLNL